MLLDEETDIVKASGTMAVGPGITEVAVRMDGRTRSLVPEFTIHGEMETQLERMAGAIREHLESC